MARNKKHCMEPVNGLNTRAGDREDCESYLECLTEASKKMLKCLPCPGCTRYKHLPIEREYIQRQYINGW